MDDAELVFVDTATKCGGGLRHAQGESRLGALPTHRGGIPHRVRGGGSHQHPLRYRESSGDGLREDLSEPPQERLNNGK